MILVVLHDVWCTTNLPALAKRLKNDLKHDAFLTLAQMPPPVVIHPRRLEIELHTQFFPMLKSVKCTCYLIVTPDTLLRLSFHDRTHSGLTRIFNSTQHDENPSTGLFRTYHIQQPIYLGGQKHFLCKQQYSF